MPLLQLTPSSFNYNDTTEVLNGHSLELEVDPKQNNKLYGIIGPSGTGKTTLLSIFGGQLRPQIGNVLINDIDIYQTDDYGRRRLIAMQMQTSTSLRGKLKYNLLFGLPKKVQQDFTDQYLIEILQKVGLWSLFEKKEGLETLIGEGGLNLSGGQRQRLNFAGLYLRSKYYHPSLILIDEPTSSLDEISEQAVTTMIREISKQTLTLVVAHRLKTLDDAVAILDTSLLASQKEMIFYPRDELVKNSQYFRDLLSGKAVLED